jgi:hypothetical protein
MHVLVHMDILVYIDALMCLSTLVIRLLDTTSIIYVSTWTLSLLFLVGLVKHVYRSA